MLVEKIEKYKDVDFVEPDGLSDEFEARLVVGGNFEPEVKDSELKNPSNLGKYFVLAKLKGDSKLAKLESKVGNGGDAGPSELVGMLNSASFGTSIAGGGSIRGVMPSALVPPLVKSQSVTKMENGEATDYVLKLFDEMPQTTCTHRLEALSVGVPVYCGSTMIGLANDMGHTKKKWDPVKDKMMLDFSLLELVSLDF
ncbi:hypothetical protein HS088_TW04G01350 [Tripterygium wilfordii]|uniref:Uncharacterized protein n=1 Tax=Tripterygium wilfordii TaxID=458696 RepID=A0A7J7DSU2_TRIWF|nr:hypothetical protein HS088_TW04G01350 [Tripterygium wilfordii]